MAVRALVVEREANWVLASWAGLTNGDTGAPFQPGDYADMTVQFAGTFDTTTALLEGSNDGVTYATLTDAQATAISKSAVGLEQVAEVPRYVRPRISAGGGSTSVAVYLYARRSV